MKRTVNRSRPLLFCQLPSCSAPATRLHFPIFTVVLQSSMRLPCPPAPSDDTDARLRFAVCSPRVGSRWRGRWIGRGSRHFLMFLVNIVNVWRNIRCGRAKKCDCGLVAAGIIGNTTHFFPFLFINSYKVRVPQRRERHSSLMCSLPLER